jgi:hypothetical protein
MGRRLSVRGRTSRSPRHVAVAAAAGVAVLLLAALALALTTDGTHRSRTAGGRVRPTHSVDRPGGAVSRRQLARAHSVARQFLAGYLGFAYGEAPVTSMRAVAPALRRRLRGQHVLVAPVERRRHPRVISLVATGRADGSVLATALVDDGGVANYAVRVTLRETRAGWLVSAVDGG